MTRQIRILTFGTFDLLHRGHHSFLRQAKRLGTKLIVAVGRDRVVHTLKGRYPNQSERTRLRRILAVPFVDQALLAPKNPGQRFAFIKRIASDIIALGYDQTFYTNNLAGELRRHGLTVKIIRLKPFRPKKYKTTLLRSTLAKKKKS